MTVIDVVREFLGTQLRIADVQDVDPDWPLVQRGVIDSIELMQIVAFVEERFGIAVDDTEVVPGNFRTLSAIAGFVARKQTAGHHTNGT